MYRIAKQVVSKQQEMKYYDINQAGAISILDTGSVINLSSFIALGDTQSARDGSVLMNKGILFSYMVTGNLNTLVASQRARIIIFRCYSENLATIAPVDIIQYVGSTISTISPKQYNTRSKYKILYDKTHNLASGWVGIPGATAGAPATTPGFHDVAVRRRYIKFNHKTTYDANATNIRDGGIYLLYISDVATSHPSFVYSVRYFFTDS